MKEKVKMINLTHSEKQLILYTKGHFEKSVDSLDDIKRIASKAYDINKKTIEMYSIVHFVCTLYDKLVTHGYINGFGGLSPLQTLLKDIFERNLQRDDNSLLDYLYKSLYAVKTKRLNLGKADPNYLNLLKGTCENESC